MVGSSWTSFGQQDYPLIGKKKTGCPIWPIQKNQTPCSGKICPAFCIPIPRSIGLSIHMHYGAFHSTCLVWLKFQFQPTKIIKPCNPWFVFKLSRVVQPQSPCMHITPYMPYASPLFWENRIFKIKGGCFKLLRPIKFLIDISGWWTQEGIEMEVACSLTYYLLWLYLRPTF